VSGGEESPSQKLAIRRAKLAGNCTECSSKALEGHAAEWDPSVGRQSLPRVLSRVPPSRAGDQLVSSACQLTKISRGQLAARGWRVLVVEHLSGLQREREVLLESPRSVESFSFCDTAALRADIGVRTGLRRLLSPKRTSSPRIQTRRIRIDSDRLIEPRLELNPDVFDHLPQLSRFQNVGFVSRIAMRGVYRKRLRMSSTSCSDKGGSTLIATERHRRSAPTRATLPNCERTRFRDQVYR